MIVYIVGGVTGVSCWEEKFNQVKETFEKAGYTVITPVDYPEGLSQTAYMMMSCQSVFIADKLVALSTWADSPGAKAEVALAQSIGKRVEFLVK